MMAMLLLVTLLSLMAVFICGTAGGAPTLVPAIKCLGKFKITSYQCDVTKLVRVQLE